MNFNEKPKKLIANKKQPAKRENKLTLCSSISWTKFTLYGSIQLNNKFNIKENQGEQSGSIQLNYKFNIKENQV